MPGSRYERIKSFGLMASQGSTVWFSSEIKRSVSYLLKLMVQSGLWVNTDILLVSTPGRSLREVGPMMKIHK